MGKEEQTHPPTLNSIPVRLFDNTRRPLTTPLGPPSFSKNLCELLNMIEKMPQEGLKMLK